MFDFQTTLLITAGALAGTGMIALLAAWCWHGWLDLKRAQLGHEPAPRPQKETTPSTMSRIEVADLKERVRRLEAIAAGVDL